MTWTSARIGFGPMERDESNGEDAAGDGGPMRLANVSYQKGLGATKSVNVNVTGVNDLRLAVQQKRKHERRSRRLGRRTLTC